MTRYNYNSCPSGYKTGTLEMDVPMAENVTQLVMFQICVPRTDEDNLALGLGLGLGLGIPFLILVGCWFYCCWIPRRRQRRLYDIQDQHRLHQQQQRPPTENLFNYLGQNMHRQFNTGILTDDLRSLIDTAPPRIRDDMITVARENNRQQLLDYLMSP